MAQRPASPGTTFTGPLYFNTPDGTEVAELGYNPTTGLTFEVAGQNDLVAFPTNAVKKIVTLVDASGAGTAQTTNVGVVPEGAVLLGVIARVRVAFNSAGAKTLEVGIGGNIDKYIDTTDFNPATPAAQACSIGGANNDQKTYEYFSANTTLIATWTNAAAATEGLVEVIVLYV